MGKLLVVVGIVIAFVASLALFLVQPGHNDTNPISGGVSGEPRIIIDDFAVYRYKGHKLTASLTAKLGHFIEPNVVEAFASIRAVRFKPEGEESLRCEAAHAQFEAEHMRDLLKEKDAMISYAEVEDQVRLGVRDNMLRTEHAQYFAEKDLLTSREPVQVDGPNRTFVGEQGFNFNVLKETLELPGKVRGVVQPSAD